ncbi:MAG: methionyl-tRNA formyltransferase [Chloroflexia bacterium]|nr:methionyl-tRNA formyltransferase [Chloroflexia bacterium]
MKSPLVLPASNDDIQVTRVIFMGSPKFAVPTLRVLLEEDYDIAVVVTQPDRPLGRSGQPQAGPVKQFAREHGLELWQPETLRTAEAKTKLRELAPDIIIVAAYGEILQPQILMIPPQGCLNIHASLLPRHRGPAPVAASILAGDAQTGVTLMQMGAGMDNGAILAQDVLPLKGTEHRGELTAKLSELGAALLRRKLPPWLAAAITPQPQDEDQATYCQLLRKQDGEIDWTQSAIHIERQTRAYDPWPGTYTFLQERRLRIWRARPEAKVCQQPPGTISLAEGQIQVCTGKGILILEQVQLAGRQRLPGEQFARGQQHIDGLRLGSPSRQK